MLCWYPYRKGPLELGCGRCEGCRANRNRLWTGRMLLESFEHKDSCFVTLTYNQENVPCHGYLLKDDLQCFLKRVRFIRRRAFRYFAVGEYGESNLRPHYHMVLFGVSPLEEKILRKCWPFGFVHVGFAEPKSMSYVSSYVMKGWTKDNVERLEDRPCEFAMMSLKPGIGLKAVEKIVLAAQGKSVVVHQNIDKFRWSSVKYPLGRYLKEKLRERLGITDDEKGARLSALIEQLFREKVSEGAEYNQKRAARVQAGHARLRRKEKVL